eukprot:GHVR01029530.1.p1 GENE.GHVR01029530.1~~GHVR01029530.1.p1  ORF type:complete len:163 (+),score=31.93 GHVR01029530.1:35-490(+)
MICTDISSDNKDINGINKVSTMSDTTKGPLLHEIFIKTANDYPDNIAVESYHENIYWKYKELKILSIHLSSLLKSFGVVPDELIAIFIDRSCYIYLCMISILMSGSGYVSIDPDYPEERINHIINDSNAKLIIVQDNYISTFHKKGNTHIH